MIIRVKFSKRGVMKFVGHLDMMRYFQKANRRAGVDIKYSEGYSPHQIISFAAPLGVGVLSRGEYFDMVVNSTLSSNEMIKKMNDAMAEGVEILSYRVLPDNAKNCMSIVAGADYNAYFDSKVFDGAESKFAGDLEQCGIEALISAFYSQTEINVLKKTKKSERIVDIKPMIYEIKASGKDCVFMKVAQGSTENLKPELVFAALCAYAGIENGGATYERLEMYADAGDNNEKKLVSLDSFGEEIE